MFKDVSSRALIICALIGVGYVVGTFSGPALAQKKIEYKVIEAPGGGEPSSALESRLNDMGDKGWDFIGYGKGEGNLIFKR